MNSLDEKLREILHIILPRVSEIEGMTEELHEQAISTAIDQLKAAFAEEGWFNLKELKEKDDVYKLKNKLLSGAEWYDRFIQALDDEFHQFSKPMPGVPGIHYDAINVHKAAKRASGLEDESGTI